MEDTQDTPAAKTCCDWQGLAEDLRQRTENFARDEPAKAVGLAALGGLLLTILPVGHLVRGLLRLAVMLAKPALFIFGAMKLYEQFDKKPNP